MYSEVTLHNTQKSTGALSIYSIVTIRSAGFLCNSTLSLGFDVTPEGMCISNSKVWSLTKWPLLTTVNESSHSWVLYSISIS